MSLFIWFTSVRLYSWTTIRHASPKRRFRGDLGRLRAVSVIWGSPPGKGDSLEQRALKCLLRYECSLKDSPG